MVATQAITSHESKKMARMGGQSGRRSGCGSRRGFASAVAVVEGMVEVASGVGIFPRAASGVW